jgi:hypothetical protein
MKNVAHNNDYGTRRASRLSFLADQRTNCWVRVNGTLYSDDWIDAMGDFTLSWSLTPAPRLTSFSPANGSVGTKVTLVGADFTLTTGVEFNGVSAQFAAVTNSPDQRLVATVPVGAGTGYIRIVTPAGIAVSESTFEVPEPSLLARWVAEDRIELSWPAAYSGWELEFSLNLGPGAAWTKVLGPGELPKAGPTDDWTAEVPTAGSQGYFRLIKQP